MNACAPNEAPPATESESADDEDEEDPSSEDEEEEGDVTEDLPEEERGTPAVGIALQAITANQGVEITLAEDREFVVAEERNAPLIGNRPALFRAFYRVDDDWKAREIEARLVLRHKDGTVRIFRNTKLVEEDSSRDAVDGGFFWGLEKEEMVGDADFHIALFEVDEDAAPEGNSEDARLPAQGREIVGGITDTMRLELVVVPTCDHWAFEEWEKEAYTNYVYNMYPINELDIEFRDPVEGGCDQFEAAYTTMPEMRMAENGPPWRFYGGVVNNGDCGGVAIFAGFDWAKQQNRERSFGLCERRWVYPPVGLFAHELGHVHGGFHTFDEDGVYPYDGCGMRETQGFGVTPGEMPIGAWGDETVPMQQLIPPSSSACSGTGSWQDVMSYQYPFWISDYHYLEFAKTIYVISQWKEGGVTGDYTRGRTIRGVLAPDGRTHFGASRGTDSEAATRLQSDRSALAATFFSGDDIVAEAKIELGRVDVDPPRRRFEAERAPRPKSAATFTIYLPEGVMGERFEFEYEGRSYSVSTAGMQ